MEFLFTSEFVSHSGSGNEWKLVDVANNSQRGSDERVKEKMEKIKQFARVAARRDTVAELGVSPEDRDEVQRLKEALQETHVASFREREQAKVASYPDLPTHEHYAPLFLCCSKSRKVWPIL